MHNQLIILGGMGPQASLRLHELLLQKSRQFHDGAPDAYPSILHVSMHVPDFIDSPQHVASAIHIIRLNCAQLPLETASAIGLACNTAHMLLPKLPLNLPSFVSMIDAVVEEIVASGASKVGLLASPYTLRTKLYENVFRSRGIDVVLPNEADRTILNTIIHRVISGADMTTSRMQLNRVAMHLQANGADILVLGCTELPLVGVDNALPVIDSLSSLADAMLRKNNRSAVYYVKDE